MKYNYTKSIFSYFVLLSFFGIFQSNAQIAPQNKYSKQLAQIVASYDQAELSNIYSQHSSKASLNRAQAKSYAILHNIPLRYENAEGVLFELQFIAEDGTPIYFRTFNANAAISTRANYLNSGGGLGLNLNGDDLTAHIWDGGLARTTHQEYDGTGGNNRFTIGDGTTALHFHSAHVTGTVIASGVQPAAKGMAWQANAVGYDWNNDTSEATTAAASGMLISNHSYGYGAPDIPNSWFGQYGQDARDWDAIMRNAPYYLMVVAAGNDGDDNTSNGAPLDGQSAYDKLSGHATAKNNLVVANGQDATINPDGSLNSVTRNSGSSEGPTDDYRIKPDIMGNGTSLYSTLETSNSAYGNLTGTSMASPNVAGTLLLLQEHYVNLYGNFMRAATLKGLALHTADDVAPTGPDAQTGWGLMNAKKAAETLTTAAASSGTAIVEELSLAQGQTYQITVQANGVNPLMASISWTDSAGTINNGTNSNTPALVNDLDIRLSNGTTFTPWRLNAVNSNTKGDNIVDPYERVDINGASGTYTLTVTHKGTLSGGSQNFSLIVTGVVVASSPLIGFATPTNSQIENTDCDYTDVNVVLNIAQAPSQNADVIFTVEGSSTATSGLDFDLLTPTVTFPSGSTDDQNMVLRIYHDGFVEGDETISVSFTVNPNGGDAAANSNADTFTLTINDDDNVPVSTQNIVLLDEDFESTAWAILDGDGDGRNWIGLTGITYNGITGNFPGSETNLTILGGTGKANANNYLISPQITIPAGTTNTQFVFGIGGYNTLEHYAVYWATNISSAANINSGVILEERNSLAGSGEFRTINTASIAGQTGYFVVRHFNSFANNGILLFDNVTVTVTVPTLVQTAINTGTTNDLVRLNGAGTIYTSDATTAKIMLDITNNESFDYGCTDISVSRAGTGAQPYNGSAAPNLVMDKNFRIAVGNSTSSGNTSVTFYFTEAEISGWESATGLSRTELVAYRTDADEIVPLTMDTFGSNITLTGDFSGLSGDYLFGPETVFVGCPGTTTYTSSGWSNGVPTANMMAVIDENYSTATANIDACTLVVNAGKTLTVLDGTYIKVEGDITVDGTLFIANEGSLVQVDDEATVANNGSITVQKITPFLDPKYFMVLGSPMTAETRDGVYGSSVIVRNHITANFVPNPDVESQDPLAENFADDNGDNWQNYVGTVHAGEGYLVLPQPDLASSGSYILNYTLGTLNNGKVNYPVIYNGTQNASMNVVGNPYPSAIDANLFLDDPDNSMIDAVYFWEHLTAASPSYPGYSANNYDMGDISMYNSSGGLPAANDTGNSTQPNGYISSGQGFGFKAAAAGTASFKNYMRVTDNNDTYRRPPVTENRIWLQVHNETYGLNSGMLINFSEEATNGHDPKYDAKRLATPVTLYSISDSGEELAIQGRSEFDVNQEIPLGFGSQVEEKQMFKISISGKDGEIWRDTWVYLEDKPTNVIHDLNDSPYIFMSKAGMYKHRFVLHFKRKVLDVPTNQLEFISIVPNPTSGKVSIVSPNIVINSVEVFDVRGRKLMDVEYGNTEYILNLSNLQAATYFVKLNTVAGSLTKRIVKN